VSSAFYFFYRWVQTIIQKSLQRIGNNIVDTSLPDDDDDLKPPPGWKPAGATSSEAGTNVTTNITEKSATSSSQIPPNQESQDQFDVPEQAGDSSSTHTNIRPRNIPNSNLGMAGSWFVVDDDPQDVARSSALGDARNQGWSF
jgi:hypothetical protein